MSMAHSTKKADFLAMVSNMNSPRLTRKYIEVFLFDEKPSTNEVQIPVTVYRASSWREESYYSAQNQLNKYNKWLNEAKA